ncbi:MAG: FitA-like ribbon-helix-helix domain-containing protein [Gemmatimonadota bacterium]
MASFTLKNIPDDLYAALKQRAAENHRSINQEVIFCVRMELARQKRSGAEARRLLDLIDQQRTAG